MGGPTSAIVPEICMQSLETTAITMADHSPKVWERHVDDVFSIVHKIYLQELPEHNNLHPQTQFTKEEENNSTLPFLGTLVQRNHDKTILIKIYRKSMHTVILLSTVANTIMTLTGNIIKCWTLRKN